MLMQQDPRGDENFGHDRAAGLNGFKHRDNRRRGIVGLGAGVIRCHRGSWECRVQIHVAGVAGSTA